MVPRRMMTHSSWRSALPSVVDTVGKPLARCVLTEDPEEASSFELDIPVLALDTVLGPPFVLQFPGSGGDLDRTLDPGSLGGAFLNGRQHLAGYDRWSELSALARVSRCRCRGLGQNFERNRRSQYPDSQQTPALTRLGVHFRRRWWIVGDELETFGAMSIGRERGADPVGAELREELRQGRGQAIG